MFDSDVLRLKIEIFLANKAIQTQILSPTLTVVYNENIDDDVFALNIGDTKPSLTLIENIKPYPFSVRLDNPNKSPITALLQLPKPAKKISKMSIYNSLDITPIVTAVVETGTPVPRVFPIISKSNVLMNPQEFYQCVAANESNTGIILTSVVDAPVHIWLTESEPPSFPFDVFGTSEWFSVSGYSYAMTGLNSVVEIPREFASCAVWAISSASAELSVVVTTNGVLTPPMPSYIEAPTQPIDSSVAV